MGVGLRWFLECLGVFLGVVIFKLFVDGGVGGFVQLGWVLDWCVVVVWLLVGGEVGVGCCLGVGLGFGLLGGFGIIWFWVGAWDGWVVELLVWVLRLGVGFGFFVGGVWVRWIWVWVVVGLFVLVLG